MTEPQHILTKRNVFLTDLWFDSNSEGETVCRNMLKYTSANEKRAILTILTAQELESDAVSIHVTRFSQQTTFERKFHFNFLIESSDECSSVYLAKTPAELFGSLICSHTHMHKKHNRTQPHTVWFVGLIASA